jgi:hypothetical protein
MSAYWGYVLQTQFVFNNFRYTFNGRYASRLYNSRVFLERLAVAQLVKEFPAPYGTQIIITMFKRYYIKYIVAYFLKARTVEAEKQPLLARYVTPLLLRGGIS